MAMKKDKLGLFFLGKDEVDNLLEAKQSGEEDGTAVDGKSDNETEHPVDIHLFDQEGDQGDCGKEKDDVEPIATAQVNVQDAFGKQILHEGGDSLNTEAGACCAYRIESRDDNKVQQDVDDHTCCCHEVELFETSIGGKERSEDVGR